LCFFKCNLYRRYIKARTQNAEQQRIRKLVGKVAKQKGIKESMAYTPSVEGRGMINYN
jgi:transcription factor SPN1